MDLTFEIMREERLLSEAAALLQGSAPLESWPQDVRDALAGAIAEGGENPIEDRKAAQLRHHLFLDLPALSPSETQRETRAADRLRADLVGLVRCGAGLYLTELGQLEPDALR
jgi:hypothetical protein